MKVLAFNSSPNMGEGNTALILNPFLEGMREAGAEVELFYTKNLRIGPCHGDFSCVLKTPGKCILQDDMETIYPKLKAAEVIVFASPLYLDGIMTSMKNLIERLCVPCGTPFLEVRNGRTRHPIRTGAFMKKAKVVLVSNCGFWEIENFSPMVEHMKAMCENMNVEFAGALLRPHGPTLRSMLEIGAAQDVLDAALAAGRELVTEGKISKEKLSVVSRALVPLTQYVEMGNQHVKQLVEMMSKATPAALAR